MTKMIHSSLPFKKEAGTYPHHTNTGSCLFNFTMCSNNLIVNENVINANQIKLGVAINSLSY